MMGKFAMALAMCPEHNYDEWENFPLSLCPSLPSFLLSLSFLLPFLFSLTLAHTFLAHRLMLSDL